jgi:uncharacterized RDD family membrane protein YckC
MRRPYAPATSPRQGRCPETVPGSVTNRDRLTCWCALLTLSGEHDDGQVGIPGVGDPVAFTDTAADLGAAHVREHDVEQQDVGSRGAEQVERLTAAACGENRMRSRGVQGGAPDASRPPTGDNGRMVSRFCMWCGGPLPDGGARYCPSCGRSTAPPPPAAYVRRMLALVIDWAILLAVVAPIWLAIANSDDPHPHDAADLVVLHILVYGSPFLYWALLSWLGRGRTPGRRLLGIRLVNKHGDRVAYWQTVGRAFLFVVLLALAVIPAIVDLLWPLLGRRGTSICDKVTSTVVTRA